MGRHKMTVFMTNGNINSTNVDGRRESLEQEIKNLFMNGNPHAPLSIIGEEDKTLVIIPKSSILFVRVEERGEDS